MGSLYYSLRKRKYVTAGDPQTLLKMHEFSAWLGSLMVLIHAGVHFNAILPWLATVAMGVNVVSGMVGKMQLNRSRRHVRNDYSRCTCYGCHEHTTANIRRQHIEEGISKFDESGISARRTISIRHHHSPGRHFEQQQQRRK